MSKSLEQIILELQKLPNTSRIVFTNGVFDILHVGHVDYLQKAKNKGDILVIGVNSDESVKRLKGPERPINTQDDRCLVLLALKSVDYVFIFSEDTPYNSIMKLKPDVLVKGGDYDALEENSLSSKYIVGSKEVKLRGGEVITIPYIEGRSSTRIINKLKK